MKKKTTIIKLLFSLIISCILTCIVQLCVHLENLNYQLILLISVFIISFVFNILLKYNIKRYIISVICIVTVTVVAFGSLCGIYKHYEKDSVYSDPEIKSDVYKNKTVLVAVPHQDDDTNTMAGLTELFVENGSDVYIMFTTNGDSYGLGETRLKESLAVAEHYKIPEKNVIFLGYGNGLPNNSKDIYNSEPDKVVKSKTGNIKTFALKEHPAYNNGNLYTRNNLKNDIKSVILDKKPDIIFSVDCDFHHDHRACSLLLEEAMADILSENNEYNPLLYKGFAYAPEYYAPFDYYNTNFYSSKIEHENDILNDINVYKWSQRVRFPVSSKTLSRYLQNSSSYPVMKLYASQNYLPKAEEVINGDKIFWERNTNSILYNADVTVSSGNEKLLNNFKLLDFNDVLPVKALPFDGAWIPEENDKIKKASFILKEEKDISEIWLYDNPSLNDNILTAEILFDNGNVIEADNIDKNGSATKISCNQKNVKRFEIIIKTTEGKSAGLTEVEAYTFSDSKNDTVKIMKLVNSNDDFVYDYYINETGTESFSIYKYNCTDVKDIDYSVSCDNKNCNAVIKNGTVTVNCPKGEKCTLLISDKINNVSDTVEISNPKDNKLRNFAQSIDKMYNKTYCFTKQIEYYYSLKSKIYTVIFKN